MLPSFCRVTGNSRNLPKPNYFPLLPPISPVEARRICRQLGKGSASGEDHHYVPVIEFGRESRAVLCHITGHVTDEHHFQPDVGTAAPRPSVEGCRITAKHQVNPDYRYVFPVLNASGPDRELDQLKSLLRRINRLTTLTVEIGQQFVYTLDDDQLNLVLPADMEEAIRRGDIENFLLSKDGDRALIRIKNGPSISLAMRPIPQEEQGEMFQGVGQNPGTLSRQRQVREYKKRKASDSLMGSRRRFFEAKEKENEPLPASVKKMKEVPPVPSEAEDVIDADWHGRISHLTASNRNATNLLIIGPDWKDLVYPRVESWDWQSFPESDKVPEIQQQFPVHEVSPLKIPVEDLDPGIFKDKPILSEDTVGFETVPVYEPIKQNKDEMSADMVEAFDKMDPAGLEQLKEVFTDLESLMFLPFIHEVGGVTDVLNSGILGHMILGPEGIHFVPKDQNGIDPAAKSVSGLMVPLPEGDQRFIVGKEMKPSTFVPGCCVNSGQGDQFLAGVTVQTPEGAGFIPGVIFEVQPGEKHFSAGEIMETEQGRKFVSGQALQTLYGPKFVAGKTIKTGQGLKFAVGQTVSKDGEFVPGQIFPTANGHEFVSGATFDTPQGARFVAGRVTPDGFIPGQTIEEENGQLQFTPGQTIETPDGPLFMPGLSIKTAEDVKFYPGRQLMMDNGKTVFVPGETMMTESSQGQFVAGCIIETDEGRRFIPCKVEQTTGDHCGISLAKQEEDVFTRPGLPSGLPIDNSTFSALPRKKPDMGYMIQYEERVKFLPTEQNQEAFGNEKVVPGQLLEMEEFPKFVPGKMIETALGARFIPGQIVKTNRGEQFVPGQVVETKSGPKFFPGQVVETKEGKRFVPGQVFDSKRGGPRFVPGKILHTQFGSTFIPGQVVYTDVGSRFLPGQVVETSTGPYFVPGKVAEHGSTIKFVPGEIIETESGPRYVAQETDDGIDDLEILVQGFEVTPEELRLITAYPFAALHHPFLDEPIINSRMLRQMAAAGLAVNRHTTGHLNDVIISAPTDKDESILGANAFRMTEPVFATKKSTKTKEESAKEQIASDAKIEGTAENGDRVPVVHSRHASIESNVVHIDGMNIGSGSNGNNEGATSARKILENLKIESVDKNVNCTDSSRSGPGGSQGTATGSHATGSEVNLQLAQSSDELKGQNSGSPAASPTKKESATIHLSGWENQSTEEERRKAAEIEAMLKEKSDQASAYLDKRNKGLADGLGSDADIKNGLLKGAVGTGGSGSAGSQLEDQLSSNPQGGTQSSIKQINKSDQIGTDGLSTDLTGNLKKSGLLGSNEQGTNEDGHNSQSGKLKGILDNEFNSKENDSTFIKLGAGRNSVNFDPTKDPAAGQDSEGIAKLLSAESDSASKIGEMATGQDKAQQKSGQENPERLQPIHLGIGGTDQIRNSNANQVTGSRGLHGSLLEGQESDLDVQNQAATKKGIFSSDGGAEGSGFGPGGNASTANRASGDLSALLGSSFDDLQDYIFDRDSSLERVLSDIFRRIKKNLELVEKDPEIREMLAAAIGWAEACGRLDLVEKVRNLMDILSNTERDPDVIALLKQVIMMKLLAQEDDEALLLFQLMAENPAGLSLEQIQKVRAALERSRGSKIEGGGAKGSAGVGASHAGTSEFGSDDVDSDASPNGKNDKNSRRRMSRTGGDDFDSDVSGQGGRNKEENEKSGRGGVKGYGSRRKGLYSGYAESPEGSDGEKALQDGEEDGMGDSMKMRKKPPRGNARRIHSRSSSRLIIPGPDVADLSEESDESLAAILGSDARYDPNCPVPPVINSARDISKEIIDTLRYSNDETKKELYTQKILEAIGCGVSASDADEEVDDLHESGMQYRAKNRSRKGSACIILKDFLQTIVPRNAAHDVLVGDIDYMIIDDDGVRYFESASGFASRRNSRFDIRQSARSRSGSRDESCGDLPGVWPWADVAPHSKGRRISIDEFRKRMQDTEIGMIGQRSRAQSGERSIRPTGRHSVSGFAPLTRSSSGYVTPAGMDARSRSRRGSIDVDVGSSSYGRKRKVGLPDLPPPSGGIRNRMHRQSISNDLMGDSDYHY